MNNFRNVIIYFLAYAISGIASFSAIALYTRYLSPEEYGKYALLISTNAVLYVVFFRWIGESLERFYSDYLSIPELLLSNIRKLYLINIIIYLCISLIIIAFIHDLQFSKYIIIGCLLTCAQAWYQQLLFIVRSKLLPKRYLLYVTTQSILTFAIGISLTIYFKNMWGALLGALVGSLFVVILGFSEWRKVPWTNSYDPKLTKTIASYGLPLSIAAILQTLITYSDRYLLAFYKGVSVSGLYSVGYDLSYQAMTALITILTFATFPIVTYTHAKEGITIALELIIKHGLLFLTVMLPITVCLCLLSNNISFLLVGESFRPTVSMVMPWIIVSAFFTGLKIFYIDILFKLACYNISQIVVMALTLLINILIALLLIPKFEIMGAVYASFISSLFALFFSWHLLCKKITWPGIHKETNKIIIATLIMGLCLYSICHLEGLTYLCIQLFFSVLIYSIVLITLDLLNFRTILFVYIKQQISSFRKSPV